MIEVGIRYCPMCGKPTADDEHCGVPTILRPCGTWDDTTGDET